MNKIRKSLAMAWALFDKGDYQSAESLYLKCYDEISKSDAENFNTVLMGLMYTESFLKKYEEARKFGNLLLCEARNEEEKHIALHQLGMVERMAGNLSKANQLFVEEERLLFASFPNDYFRMSANLYEQGYIAFQMENYAQAENIMFMSLDYAIKARDDVCMGCAYRGMGEIMKAVGKVKTAMDYFEKAIVSFANAGDLIAVEEIKSVMEITYN